MLNFNHVYYFHVTAAEGSVKAAADRLGVTQPTVSEQIKMLERTLGVTLFDRTPSGLRLTEAGRQAFEHTTAMFVASERLVQALARATTPPPLALGVGMSASISRTIAADFLMPVLSVENCRPVIRTGDLNDLLRDLRAHELDLVISETEPMEAARRGLEIVTLHRPTLVAIGKPDITPREDWKNLSLLEYRSTSAFRWEVDAFLEEKGLEPSTTAELDDAFLMLESVASSGCVAFVPTSVARDAIATGRVKVLAKLSPTTAAVRALFHQSETSDLVRRAVEKLAENARTHFELRDVDASASAR